MKELNEAETRTSFWKPLYASDPAASPYLTKTRITTLLELIQDSEKTNILCGDYEAHLMVESEFNPGEYFAKPMYDYSKEPMPDGKFSIDVHEGELIVPGDTLLYWM